MSGARNADGARSVRGARVAVAILVSTALGAAGCASSARLNSPAPPAAVGAAQVARMTQALAARARILDSLQSRAVMEYSSPDRHVKASEEIIVRRPDSLRVEAMSPFGVAAVVAARGARLEIFEPGKNRLLRGAATAATLDRFARIPLAPASAVDLLLGLAPNGAPPSGAEVTVAADDGMTVASYPVSGGGTLELGFADGQLAMVRQRAPSGLVTCDVRYSEYRDIGGIMFAYVVEADFPGDGTRVTFRFERPIINGAAPDSLFVLTPGANTRLETLSLAPSAGYAPAG